MMSLWFLNSPQGFLDQIMLKYYHMYDKIKGNHFIKSSVIDSPPFVEFDKEVTQT